MAQGRLMNFLKLSEDEQKDFRLLFVQSLFSGFGSSFFFVVVNTYFIKKTSVQSLPPAYIMSGIFGYLLITLYKNVQRRSGVIFAYTFGYLVYGLSALLLFAGRLYFPDASPVSLYIAYAGFVVVLPFASMQALGFSTICLRVFNIAQSKRLLALIGTGEVLASVAAYIIIPFLTKWMGGPAPLLLLSGTANIIAILPLRLTYVNNKHKLDSLKFSNIKRKMNLEFFRKDRFYLFIAVVTLFSVIAIYFADYAYLLSVRYIAAESGAEVAVVVAVIFSIIKSGELIASLLSGKLLRQYGMRTSLVVLPVALVLSTFIGVAMGTLFMSIPFFLVIFLLFDKWCERVVRKGITIPAMKVVYQVTHPDERAQLQTSVEGTISQYATILAGLLLLLISLLVSSKDILYFLRILAVIYLAAYGGWVVFSYYLYHGYRIKIKEYLHTFTSAGPDADLADFEIDAEVMEAHTQAVQQPMVQKALAIPQTGLEQELLVRIAGYNPIVRNSTDTLSLGRKVSAAYYNNENYFSRLLIIRYMQFQDEPTRVAFFKEYYAISELPLRRQIVTLLNNHGYKVPESELFFVNDLCSDLATEIMWAESAIHDFGSEVSATLVAGLEGYILDLQNLLFELLKVLYEKDAIQAVQQIVNSKDQSVEHRLFAIELLDNVLEGEMKTLLMPVLEKISYNEKRESLKKLLPINNLSCEERLKELLMANFMTIGPHLKEMALEEYHRMNPDPTMLNAFMASHQEGLQYTAARLKGCADDDPVLVVARAKREIASEMELDDKMSADQLAYFQRWGIFVRGKRKQPTILKEYAEKQMFQLNATYLENMRVEALDMSIDLLGLSLLIQTDNKA